MQKGTKLIILVAVGVLIILAIVVFFVLNETKKITPTIDEQAPVAKLEVPKTEEQKLIQPVETPQDVVVKSVKPVAIAFVERFGTFTNDSNFSSIRGLSSIMTQSMLAWTNETYIPKLEAEHAPGGFFYRVTAKAPVVQIMGSTDTTAKIKVTAQREETIGTEKPRVFLQDIILDFVSVNNVWLVDAVYWQQER